MASVRKYQSERFEARMADAEAGDQLIPGIPDDITVALIGSKLPWTTFQMLAKVNRRWLQAIQRHEFYDARVRSRSRQTLLALHVDLINDQANHARAIALYSVNDGSYYLLPPIPGLTSTIQWSCGQCVFLNGEVYVLGGFTGELKECVDIEINYQTSAELYVMDLAGQGQWKKCASMQNPRAKFGCSVFNEKIYVFGGTSKGRRVWGSEVYDPTEDAWSPVAPMLSSACHQQVTTVGEELFVHSGHHCFLHTDNVSCSSIVFDDHYGEVDCSSIVADDHFRGEGNELDYYFRAAFFADVYHPLKNEWRQFVGDFPQNDSTEIVVVEFEGQLHKITPRHIDKYDNHSDSWRPLQSCSFGVLGPIDQLELDLWHAVFVDGEIIVLLCSWEHGAGDVEDEYSCYQMRLMRSERFGGENMEVVWQEVKFSLPRQSVILSLFPSTILL